MNLFRSGVILLPFHVTLIQYPLKDCHFSDTFALSVAFFFTARFVSVSTDLPYLLAFLPPGMKLSVSHFPFSGQLGHWHLGKIFKTTSQEKIGLGISVIASEN